MSDKPNYLDLERMVEQVNTYNIELQSKLKAQQELIDELESKNSKIMTCLRLITDHFNLSEDEFVKITTLAKLESCK